MSIEADQKIVDEGKCREVTLAGQTFYIAPLSLRQVLAIADFVPKLGEVKAADLSGEKLMPMIEVLWHGLRRVHKNLGKDELMDMPIRIDEVVKALPTVIEQAGGAKAEAKPGEPSAMGRGGTSPAPIGADSSQTS
jgi:hypothetical protein